MVVGSIQGKSRFTVAEGESKNSILEQNFWKTTSKKSIFKLGSSESMNRILEKEFTF